MRLEIPSDQLNALAAALKKAGNKEIGGQLFGEQLAPSEFRATDITFQHRRGTFARFVVDLVQAAKDASRFFQRTQHQYSRYNYIGEWHSHPSFAVSPSSVDLQSMRDLVSNEAFQGNFAVLMIVRLDDELRVGAWCFDPAGNESDVILELAQ